MGNSIKSSGVKLDDKTKAVFLYVPNGLFIFDAAKLLRRKMIKKKVGRKKIKKKKKRLQQPLQRQRHLGRMGKTNLRKNGRTKMIKQERSRRKHQNLTRRRKKPRKKKKLRRKKNPRQLLPLLSQSQLQKRREKRSHPEKKM